MKRLFFTLAMLLHVCATAKAQEGTIIYTDFNPDTIQTVYSQIPGYEPMYVDFDGDGQYDLEFYAEGHFVMVYAQVLNTNEWDISQFCNEPNKPFTEKSGWVKQLGFGGSYCEKAPDSLCIRHKIGDRCYYGWFRAYTHDWDLHPIGPAKVVLDKMAWCTVPNYPLIWGETSLTSIEVEDEVSVFVTIIPNPATDIVAIIGKDLKAAEVINALGQRVATANGRGGRLTVDIGSLPVGVYSVIVTDESGKKCVRKVVKE